MKLGELIAKGNTADIYAMDDKKVVKLFKPDFPGVEAEKEASKQQFAKKCGLHVPKIFDVTIINNRQAIIMEYMNATPLGEYILGQTKTVEEIMLICVKVQQHIHQIAVKDHLIESMSEKLEYQITNNAVLNKKQKRDLLKELNKIDYTAYLCHGDFHPFNVLIDEKKDETIIIDWVDASAGDIRADVYRTYLLLSGSNQELADLYVNQYCSTSEITQDEVFQWGPIIAGARLFEVVPSENKQRLINVVNGLHR
ncbi:aminoglycoside phosphotransferase family protein [Oceanobacillus kimchii]|uniref:aminoglycoside phosphotransferase family protein n=1 Tax=Oceanobacillus kimchii TaxID=746691 RepID=UPI003C75EA1C